METSFLLQEQKGKRNKSTEVITTNYRVLRVPFPNLGYSACSLCHSGQNFPSRQTFGFHKQNDWLLILSEQIRLFELKQRAVICGTWR
jgi:hypothetical protein